MSEFPRYSPENSGNNEKAQKVLKVKNLASELLSVKADDEEAWIKKAGIVRDMFETTGYGATSIQSLNEVEKDENKTDKQKEMAREAKDVLVTGMYEAMLDTNDEELEMALGTGNISKIEAMWPKDFKGAGREMMDKVTGDSKITEVLMELDNSRQRNKNKGELGKKQFSKKLENSYEIIDEINGLNEEGKRGQELVMTYLSMESEELNEKEEKEGQEGEVEKLARLFSSERAESTYETFVTAEFLQQPIQLQVDTFPPSWFRNKPDNFHGTISDWQQVIRARINLTNASYIKAEVAALDGEKAKNNNYLKLSEKELKIIYEMDGVRETMHNIVDNFFTLEKDPNSNAEFLVLKIPPEVKGEEEKKDTPRKKFLGVLAGFRDYQESLVEGLMKKNRMSENDARSAVAASWNFLYVSNVFESADIDRDIGGECGNIFGEQIRAMMHPLSKAKAKFIRGNIDDRSQGTEEGWGGNVGAWFADMFTWNDTRSRFAQKLNNGEIKPFPKRIGASMVDLMEVKTEDGLKMSLGRAILDNKKVVFNRADSNLFGEYGDKWDTFFKYYYYSTGKNLIQFGKNLDEWSNSLADLLAKIRSIKSPGTGKQMFQELDSSEAFGWIMLNSVGIVRSPELMLDIPEGLNYEAIVDVILQQPRLVPEKDERKRIKKMLNGEAFAVKKRFSIKWDAMSRSGKAPRSGKISG